MKDFKFYCGIFATLFVATTATLLTSCSQEDDDYDTDMYTLAERMGTRALGGDVQEPMIAYYYKEPTDIEETFSALVTIIHHFKCEPKIFSELNPEYSSEVVVHDNENVVLASIIHPDPGANSNNVNSSNFSYAYRFAYHRKEGGKLKIDTLAMVFNCSLDCIWCKPGEKPEF